MTQEFLYKDSRNSSLLLFFAGWGSEAAMFKATVEAAGPIGHDILLCSDYRTLDFDAEAVAGYQRIYLVGWSMGVWAAGKVLPALGLPVVCSVAVCGTPFPIDNSLGIPEAVFRGTLERMSGPTLLKFRRRMCGAPEALEQLLSAGLTRSTEELREELSCIAASVAESGVEVDLKWDKAVVGERDAIFPPANQCAAWERLGVPEERLDVPHYDREIFEKLLISLQWTNS